MTKFGGELLYVPVEQMLYTFNAERNGMKEFVCYQTVLSDRRKKNSANAVKCTSRVKLMAHGKCQRMNENIPHTNHANHQMLAEDKKNMNSMTERCQNLRSNHPEDAFKIPTRHIFQHEIKKYGFNFLVKFVLSN